MYIMLGSVRVLQLYTVRAITCVSVQYADDVRRAKASADGADGIDGTDGADSSDGSDGAEVAARGLDSAESADIAGGADHKGPRQSRSWDSWWQARVHGSQALLRAARVRGVRVVRASRAPQPDARRGRECHCWRGASRQR